MKTVSFPPQKRQNSHNICGGTASFARANNLFRTHRRKFRSQTSDIMDRWKRGGKSQRREEKKKQDQRRERVRRKKMRVRESVEKSRFTVCLPMICGSGGSKSRLAKAAGAEPSGQMRDEKLHAIVARSKFRSQNVQNTPFSEHFWKL